METLQKPTEASQLKEIFTNAMNRQCYSGYGVVLDSTHVYKANDQYFVRMKVVDSSLNHQDNQEETHQPMIVLLFANKSKHQLPQVKSVGSIIRFKNMQFSDRKKYVQGTSRGDRNSFVILGARQLEEIQKKKEKSQTKEEERVLKLFKWSQTYFNTNSLLSMEWFQKTEESSVEDFDYLLKNTGTTHRGRRYTFVNLHGNEIVYDIPEGMTRKDFDIIKSDVVKFRSLVGIVENQTKELQAFGNKYTSLLRLPPYFKDVKQFAGKRKEQEDDEKSKKKVKKVQSTLEVYKNIFIPNHELSTYGLDKQKLKTRIQWLWDQKHQSEYQMGSYIRTDYLDLQVHDMAYLLRGSLDSQIYHIRGSIHNISPNKLENMVRRYCLKCNEQFNIQSKFNKCPRCDVNLKSIYLFKLLMKDESIFDSNQFFEAYVFTYDKYPSPSNFFPRVCLHDFNEQMKSNKPLLGHLNSLLKSLPLKINVSYDFVVQAQVSYDDPQNVIYRIVDSFMAL